MTDKPKWIEHDGSAVCPVPAGHDVEVRFRDAPSDRDRDPQGWTWEDAYGDCSITHYRDWTAFKQEQSMSKEFGLNCGNYAEAQSMSKDVPEWAVGRAYDLARDFTDDRYVGEGHLAQAFARYIAAHEPAPVDPLRVAVIEAEKVAASSDNRTDDDYWDNFAAALRARLPAAALDALGGE